MSAPIDLARWMFDELNCSRAKELSQEEAVYDIRDRFGEEFIYYNDAGNLAIDRRVLDEFKKLTRDSVVWERGLRLWRLHETGDEPGRRQN